MDGFHLLNLLDLRLAYSVTIDHRGFYEVPQYGSDTFLQPLALVRKSLMSKEKPPAAGGTEGFSEVQKCTAKVMRHANYENFQGDFIKISCGHLLQEQDRTFSLSGQEDPAYCFSINMVHLKRCRINDMHTRQPLRPYISPNLNPHSRCQAWSTDDTEEARV